MQNENETFLYYHSQDSRNLAKGPFTKWWKMLSQRHHTMCNRGCCLWFPRNFFVSVPSLVDTKHEERIDFVVWRKLRWNQSVSTWQMRIGWLTLRAFRLGLLDCLMCVLFSTCWVNVLRKYENIGWCTEKDKNIIAKVLAHLPQPPVN